jgi:hypothetical protein
VSSPKHQQFFRRAVLAVWAMATLILVFCVALLAREMIRQGRSPFDLGKVPETPKSPLPGQVAPSAIGKDVVLYFASGDSRFLVAEPRRIEASEFTVENCRAVLKALAQGPQGALSPILPESAEVRAVYLLPNGELVVDLPREMAQTHQRSASTEALMVYGIVGSLAQAAVKGDRQPAVRSIRFLVEGAPPSETFEPHLDLSEPIVPDPHWIPTQEVAAPGNV